MQKLFNAWAWTATVVVVLIGFAAVTLVFLLTAPFDPGRYWAGRTFRLLAVSQVKLNPLWRFRTSGRAVSDPRRPYVVVSNHESYADIFLICLLPWEMKWLSKETIFRIPVFGWMMRMAGDVPIVRGNRDSAVGAIESCKDRLAKRASVMIFPEGTRSRTADLLPFKDGAFRLAIEAGVPILPLVLTGTRRALPKRGFIMRRANAVVRVLEPIETTGLSTEDTAQLRDRVRAVIADARAQIIAGRRAQRVTAG